MTERELTPEVARQLFAPVDLNAEQKERADREQAEANRTDAERHGDGLAAAPSLDGKRASDLALINALHGDTEGRTPIALDPIEPGPPGPPGDRTDTPLPGDEPFPSA